MLEDAAAMQLATPPLDVSKLKIAAAFNPGLWTVSALIALALPAPSVLACSARSTPKPRSPSPQHESFLRPNIAFQTYACPDAYAAWYCLNGAACFTLKISDSILYNCECADGFVGQRCEFKDLEGSYLPLHRLLPEGSGAGGVLAGVLLVVLSMAVLGAVLTKCRASERARRADSPSRNRTGLQLENCSSQSAHSEIEPFSLFTESEQVSRRLNRF